MKTAEKIIEYIKLKKQISPVALFEYLGINRQATHRQIKKLVDSKIIYKIGKPPKVFYLLSSVVKEESREKVEPRLEQIINDNFLIITPSGERRDGVFGFQYWCDKHNLTIGKTAKEYTQTIKKYNAYKKNSLIDGGYKIKHTFKQVYLDHVFYLDFYSIERFGKTKLGQLLLYAKQSQNKILIKELALQIKPTINSILKKFKIEALGYVPPTVKRETQLMKELERYLNFSIPTINLVKVKTEVAVPQKTLTKLEDRIENAKATMVVDENRKYKTILLIDDALGSGATLNEVANKLKSQGVAEKVIGVAITGSFSGFEVISEV